MGYYFVIMVFHIYIAISEKNCNKTKKECPKCLMILSKESVHRRKDFFLCQSDN